MTRSPLLLAGASLLALSLAPASAQDADYVGECVDLFAFVDASDAMDVESEPEIMAIVERNDARACRLRLARLERADAARTDGAQDVRQVRSGERDVTTATREVQQEVQLSETVTVQGDVAVVAPAPDVQVRSQAAEVRVQGQAPRVTVRHGGPEIVVRERPATIIVGMPTITIEQDAPEIVVTMPDHDVDVAMAEPTVEVRQAPPRVTVAVPDPRVDLDLRAVVGDSGEPVRTRIERERTAARAQPGLQVAERADQGADANVYVAEAEPQVEIAGLTEEPDVTMDIGEPQVRFERAEPTVEMRGEPEVRFERRGEPQVRIVRAGEAGAGGRQGLLGDGGEADDRDIEERPTLPVRDDTRAAPSPAPREAMTPTRRGGSAFAVSDMTGRTVYGANGEEIGSVERVMRLGRQTYVVVEHGGFLGLGDTDIPVPVGELRVRDGELVATNLTAERAEEMQANDIERGEDLADDDQVRVRRMR